ncbi:MAG: TIGR03118 family protein [Gemmatimonadetes bacterium]|nr:MAG: TIGR03118 family protein [Gemmatimonadota bacterium]
MSRRIVGAPLAFVGALSLACAGERSVAPPLTAPAFSLQSASLQSAPSQFYAQHNLVSDGAVPADLVDAALVNAWGLVASATSPWWIADNGTGLSTLYNGNTGAKLGLTVSVAGAPTGIVFNGGSGFVVTSGAASGPARFIFATEQGTVLGWNPTVAGTQAVVAVDNSAGGAVYKGLAIASTVAGDRLYAANFHAGTVDVFDAGFHPVSAGFSDAALPPGYAPFGIRSLGGTIYVSYALQDADRRDDVAGVGHGFVNAFDTDGHLLRRVASRGRLNSPWGLALAPADFGQFSGNLLVGNFGDGHINAFDLERFEGNGELQQRGQLHAADGPPIVIDGLWALAFGNGASAGPTNALFFTAGPFDEAHGLFGKLVVALPPGGARP